MERLDQERRAREVARAIAAGSFPPDTLERAAG
jgi:hypothetical protein